MKQLMANTLAIVGGTWTALIGILLIGSFLTLGVDTGSAPVASAMVWLSALLVAGIVMFYSGLRLMRR